MARNVPPFPHAHRNPPPHRRRSASGSRGRRGPRECNNDPEVHRLLTPFLAHVRRNIRRLRRKAGLTQEKLALATSLHPKTLQKLEAGSEKNPTLTTLAAVARSLEVDLWTLCRPPAEDGSEGAPPSGHGRRHPPR